MKTTSSTTEPPSSIAAFRSRCADEVSRVLREQELSFQLEEVEGKEESYFVFDVESTLPESLKIYVYEDEAGFFVGECWHVWETPDYDTLEVLMNAFLDGLRATAEQLRRESPPVP